MKGFLVLSLLSVAAAAPQKIEPRDGGTGEGGVEITPRAVTCAKVPSWMKSAFSATDRIVGGANAGSAIPWQVSLRQSVSGDEHFCGGTILDATTVLSAAHCFHDGEAMAIVVVAGSHKRADNTGVQTSTISKLIFDTNAKYNKQTMDNDIVILKLKTALKFNANVQPACLPVTTFAPENSKSMAVVSGWGTLKSGGNPPDILQYVNVPLMTNDDCKKTGYGTSNILPSMVCAGYAKGGKDSCQGDSGGPLVVPKGSSDDTAIIYGVVSWGSGCAGPNMPGVYARVTKFVDWIKKNMDASTPSPPPPSTTKAPSPTTAAPSPKPSSTTKKSTTTSSDDYGTYGTYGRELDY